MEVLPDDGGRDALNRQLVITVVRHDDRQARLDPMNAEIVGEAVQQDRLFDRERHSLGRFEFREEAVGINPLAVDYVRLENRLPEEQRAMIIGTPGNAEHGANARGDSENSLAEPPAAAIDVTFAGAADVAPEVEEIVLPFVAVRFELRIRMRIAGKSARSEVFDEQEGNVLIVAWKDGVNRFR